MIFNPATIGDGGVIGSRDEPYPDCRYPLGLR